MAQSTTGLPDEVQGGSLTAAEYTTLKNTVDANATDAEPRFGIAGSTTAVDTTTYTVLSTDRVVLVDDDTIGDDVTITLPSAATLGDGWSITIKKQGNTGDITIDPDGSETIDGNAVVTLQHKNGAMSIVSDGTNWCRLYPTTPKGWAYYKDANYTTSNRLVIGTNTKLEIDGVEGTSETGYLPDGVAAFWDVVNDHIVGERIGDAFDVRIAFTVDVTNATDSIEVVLDIGGGATPTIPIITQYLQFAQSGEQQVTFSFPIFTLATFITNGGQIFLTKSGGTVEVWGASIMIKRDFSPL